MVINKPPMGWNTWNTFGTDINEELVLKSAQFICDSGLKDAGYEYVIVDDCWSLKERDKKPQVFKRILEVFSLLFEFLRLEIPKLAKALIEEVCRCLGVVERLGCSA